MARVARVEPPTGVLVAVTAAVEAMTWLTPSDEALVELAKSYAAKIDSADDAKTVGWLGPHLANVLRALGGAPAERKALGIEAPIASKLAVLRAAR